MLDITTSNHGFYKGFNVSVALASKLILAAIVVWCAINPDSAGSQLEAIKQWSFRNLSHYYNWTVGFFIIVTLLITVVPKWGKVKLGDDDGLPEFSNFSWFAMMFGAGIGIGMLGFATGEPIWYLGDNPEIRISQMKIQSLLADQGISSQANELWTSYKALVETQPDLAIAGLVEPYSYSAIESVYRYEFLHWGISAWTIYALVGIALALASYRQHLPLTIRSTLYPLFGNRLSGHLGTTVDVVAVVATLLGIGQTIGLGLTSFATGVYNITGFDWLLADIVSREPSNAALFLALAVVMVCSTLSALSGVGRGIKWLSNLNMVLSFGLLTFFLIFGATWFFLKILGAGTIDYLLHLPALTFQIFPHQEPGSPGEWQAQWSVFYWAWWIAFAPFVGMFLARISRNRTIREFVLGAILAPSFMCFIWFALLGGTAIDLELSGVAQGSIYAKTLTAQLYEVINLMLSSGLAKIMSVLIVILLLTYLVTSADSATLVAKIISAGGRTEDSSPWHVIIWSLALVATIAALIIAGGISAIQAAMIIAAIPFSLLMILMAIAMLWSLQKDTDH